MRKRFSGLVIEQLAKSKRVFGVYREESVFVAGYRGACSET